MVQELCPRNSNVQRGSCSYLLETTLWDLVGKEFGQKLPTYVIDCKSKYYKHNRLWQGS